MGQFSLQNLGLVGIFLGFLALFGLGWCAWQIRKINALRKNFLAGEKTADFETAVLFLNQKLQSLEQESLFAAQEIKRLEQALHLTVQKVGIVRYSPFADGGGNYSFSLALLNAHGSGVVITNMYGRQQSRVYTKKLDLGKSEVPLTEEELRAVMIANNKES